MGTYYNVDAVYICIVMYCITTYVHICTSVVLQHTVQAYTVHCIYIQYTVYSTVYVLQRSNSICSKRVKFKYCNVTVYALQCTVVRRHYLCKGETTTTLPPPVPTSQEREPACLGYRWKHQDLQIVLRSALLLIFVKIQPDIMRF